MSFSIRLAELADAYQLPAVERSAGQLFRTVAELAWIADDTVMSVQAHQQSILRRTSWVAELTDVTGGVVIGFISAEPFDDALHIWELSVHADRQRQGVGRGLVHAVLAYAREQQLKAVTLTTFQDVPWNGPWYQHLGFLMVPKDEWGPRLEGVLTAEQEHGVPIERRCAMRYTV